MVIRVPTCYPGETPSNAHDHYGEPLADIRLAEESGLIVTLPRVFYSDHPLADVVFERRKNGWMIFIRADVNEDEAGYLQIHDDGRVCLMRDRDPLTEIKCPAPGEDGIDLD